MNEYVVICSICIFAPFTSADLPYHSPHLLALQFPFLVNSIIFFLVMIHLYAFLKLH